MLQLFPLFLHEVMGVAAMILMFWMLHFKPAFSLLLVQFRLSHIRFFVTLWTAAARPPYPSPTPGVHSNSCPWTRWCHPTISFSAFPFLSHLESFPESGSFQMSQLFASRAKLLSFSFSMSPSNEYSGLISLEWTSSISLQSKGLSRAFSNTTVKKHQFFGTQLSLYSNSHIHTWLLEKP